MAILESTYPENPPGPEPPTTPDIDGQAANLGRFATYASEEAYELLMPFLRLKWAFMGCVREYEDTEDQVRRDELINEMNGIRDGARTCLPQLEVQIRKELAAD